MFTGSIYPTNLLLDFENNMTDLDRVSFLWLVLLRARYSASFFKIKKIFFGYFDPENIFLDNKNK